MSYNIRKKTCNECLKDKTLRQFQKHPQMKDGHLNQCKECVSDYMKRYRDKKKISKKHTYKKHYQSAPVAVSAYVPKRRYTRRIKPWYIRATSYVARVFCLL